ncbi:MAG: thiol-disulfide isomerase [Candidatus Magasanikbacteria bacterium CG10_big_fil_rev_8_21_14_0_10_47_10]|uniref:Thiol-disulfide isomerase n=1 Tax=Candidatus Magasanikbacteria bacterium CG10_big_fil_rev_8_21_14_0_10_47_10 TaxID=1974652 RepID=A0A2H0TP25_9BACT|nr:MAG: thiol-disulfide isomerase [Candidatus Magasanikbacteria bacterium CG10_big_fil_rev_8_21_14_0_10_47_10]
MEKLQRFKIAIGVGTVLLFLVTLYFIDRGRGVYNAPSIPRGVSDSQMLTAEQKEQYFRKAPEIEQPKGFVNSDGITLGELVGQKVILVDMMTYSCINCQRTFPYLNAWYKKYKDQGLEIVGIHAPEFAFEGNIENVRDAMKKYGIEFPVVLDNDYGTWNAYGNRFWPQKYLIDIDGFIVYEHIGEGGYAESENKIQELLRERADRLHEEVTFDDGMVDPSNKEFVNPLVRRSPETYFGSRRNFSQGIVESTKENIITFAEPTNPQPDKLYLVGDWKITDEYAEAASPNAKIIYRYQAQKVFLVASAESAVNAQILVDGKSLSVYNAGVDTSQSRVTFDDEALYRLIEGEEYGTHVLEIIFDNPGVRAFAFTFG